MAGPFEGLRVVEYGEFISAPYCAKLLADLGADVVKVEPPGGDRARQHGPFLDQQPDPERSGLFLYLNANKLGVTLNIEVASGVAIMQRLLVDADVFIENTRPGDLGAAGLDFAGCAALNPRLIMVSLSPFGQTGPYRHWRGEAINAAALGGMSLIVGEPGRAPLTAPLCWGHYQCGTAGAIGASAALLHRQRSGKGQHVDVSESDGWAIIAAGQAVGSYVDRGRKRARSGHRTPVGYPYTVLACADGYMSLIATRGDEWKRFLLLMGDGEVPEWYANDPRFKDRFVAGREHASVLDEKITPWLRARTRDQIFAMCREKHIPFAPVRTVDEVVAEPHFAEREYWVDIGRSTTGPIRAPGAPYRLSKTPWALRRPAPLLGEHNALVYGERLGYRPDELIDLRRANVI